MMATQSALRCRGMELLITYHQHPSIEVRNQLVRLNVGLVRKIAHRVSHQCAEPYEDLEQIGYLGLIRAIERFNPNQGTAFSSFAVPYIRGEMLHFLRDRSAAVKIPRRCQELQKQGQKVREELAMKLGRFPKEREIAEELGVSISEWQETKIANKNCKTLSLDATYYATQLDNPITLGDALPDYHYQEQQQLEEERQQLQSALSQLEENTRNAIESVFFLDISRKEVAKKIGVSPMTVTRSLQKGIKQLFNLLQQQMFQAES